MIKLVYAVLGTAILLLAIPVSAQDTGQANRESLSAAYSGKAYSPYAERNFPERPLWGDSHLHTSLSMDAGLFGNRLSPRARGLDPLDRNRSRRDLSGS